MKQILASVIMLLMTLTSMGQLALPLGSSVPQGDIKMKDVSGSLVSLNEAKSASGLLVIFISNTCPFVAKNQSRIKEICQLAQDNNIGVILLNPNEGTRKSGESYADMQAYAKENGYKWYYVMDSRNELADNFGATRTPECFLFNKSANLVYHGAVDDSPADPQKVTRLHLKEAISEMLSDKEVTVKETRSVGCTIHRKKG